MPFRFDNPLSLVCTGEDPNVLNRVSVITAGEAKGHGVYMDHSFLERLVELGNAHPRGIRSRFGHPDMCHDAIGTELGMFRNFRKEGSQVFADVNFVVTDSNKDMISHIREFAAKEPGVFGTSIVFEPALIRDEVGNPILNEYGEEQVAIKEVEGKKFIGIDSLDAVDFVDSPAANPNGVYSEKFSQEREKVLSRFLSRFLSDNPKVKKFVDYVFSHTQKEEHIMPVTTRKLSRFFDQKRMGESAIVGGGGVIVYPTETPQVNDAVILRDDAGNETAAPDGTYPLENGFTVTVMEGVITEVIEAASESETPAELRAARNRARELAQEVDALRKQVELQEAKKELSEKLAKATPAMPAIATNPRVENTSKTIHTQEYSAQNFVELASLLLKAKRNEVSGEEKKFKIYRKRGIVKQFNGWDLSNELARCIPYMDDIIYDAVATDSFLSKMRNITSGVPMGNVNAFDVHIPNMSFNPYDPWRVDLDDCNSFTPNMTITPGQRTVKVLPIRYEGEICALEVRNLWNGKIYVDEETIPAESVVMTMIMERLIHDLERIAIFGRTGTAGTINGIYQEIQIAKASLCIPASQVLGQGPYTDTNTIAQIEALCDLIPPFMRSMTGLSAYTTTRIWEYYYRNYRSAFNFNYEEKNREIIPDVLRSRTRWEPLITFEEQTSTDNGVLITPMENLVYVLERESAENSFKIWFMPTEEVIRLRWKNYAGFNFANCNEIVTNL